MGIGSIFNAAHRATNVNMEMSYQAEMMNIALGDFAPTTYTGGPGPTPAETLDGCINERHAGALAAAAAAAGQVKGVY